MKRFSWRFIALNALLIATLFASALSEHRPSTALVHPLETLPNKVGKWTAVKSETLAPNILQVLRPTSYLSRTYLKANRQADLFIAYYAQQRAGETFHSPNACLPSNGWEIWDQNSALVPVNGAQIKVNRYSIRKEGESALVLYWYQSQQRIIANEYLGKFLLVRDALLDGRTAGSIVRVVVSDTPGATEDAIDFSSALIPQVQFALGQ
jgi:EpsI family protein